MNDISIKIIVESKLENLPILRKAVRGVCSCVVTTQEDVLQDIDLCLNEAVSNVICHGYQNEPRHEIQVIVILHSNEIQIKIIDEGLPNIQANQRHKVEEIHNIASLSESGRGLYIIQELMDEITYETREGKNTLHMRKHFKADPIGKKLDH